MLKQIRGIDCRLSGSTGIIALLTTNHLTVANVGDSRCTLGQSTSWAISSKGGQTGVNQTEDSKIMYLECYPITVDTLTD